MSQICVGDKVTLQGSDHIVGEVITTYGDTSTVCFEDGKTGIYMDRWLNKINVDEEREDKDE